jgi:hypothetical protein
MARVRYNGDKVAFQATDYALPINSSSVGNNQFLNAVDAYNEFDWSITYQINPIMSVMLA